MNPIECPCGGLVAMGPNDGVAIECQRCGLRYWGPDREEAVAGWNRLVHMVEKTVAIVKSEASAIVKSEASNTAYEMLREAGERHAETVDILRALAVDIATEIL